MFEEPAASPLAVLVGDVEFFSTGRRDLVPFSGVCHVAYLPGRAPGGGAPRVLGLSKAARVVEAQARRLQTPQSLADGVARALGALPGLAPRGALAVVQAVAVAPGPSRASSSAVGAWGCYKEPGAEELAEVRGLLRLRGVDLGALAAGRRLPEAAAAEPASPPLPLPLPPQLPQALPTPSRGGRDLAAVERAAVSLARGVGWEEPGAVVDTAARGYARWMWDFTRGGAGGGEGRGEEGPAPTMLGRELGPGRAGFCVDFASLCEHHLLPFHGRMYVACVGVGVGASAPTLPAAAGGEVRAAVWRFSHRLQLQERLTQQVAEALMGALGAATAGGGGVLVVSSAQHHCMRSRGVQKSGSVTVAISRLGSALLDGELCEELLAGVPDLAVREAWDRPSPMLPPPSHDEWHGHGHGHENGHA